MTIFTAPSFYGVEKKVKSWKIGLVICMSLLFFFFSIIAMSFDINHRKKMYLLSLQKEKKSALLLWDGHCTPYPSGS